MYIKQNTLLPLLMTAVTAAMASISPLSSSAHLAKCFTLLAYSLVRTHSRSICLSPFSFKQMLTPIYQHRRKIHAHMHIHSYSNHLSLSISLSIPLQSRKSYRIVYTRTPTQFYHHTFASLLLFCQPPKNTTMSWYHSHPKVMPDMVAPTRKMNMLQNS